MIGEASVQPHLRPRVVPIRLRAWKVKDAYGHSQSLCYRVSKNVPDEVQALYKLVINTVHSRGICAYILIPVYLDKMPPKLE